MSAVSLAGESAKEPAIDLEGLLARVGERVEAYYQRAQSIVCIETVQLLTMDMNFAPDPHTRRLVYELRVSWDKATDGDATPEANVLRQLKSIDGRPPKPGEMLSRVRRWPRLPGVRHCGASTLAMTSWFALP